MTTGSTSLPIYDAVLDINPYSFSSMLCLVMNKICPDTNES